MPDLDASFRKPLWLRLGLASLLVTFGLSISACSDTGDDDDDGGTTSTPVVSSPTPTAPTDTDNDGVVDSEDNCPNDANADQTDIDGNGDGDACSEEVCDGQDNNGDGQTDEGFSDTDSDGIVDCLDTCDKDADNDADGDGACGDEDNCPASANAGQTDSDGDGLGDACDDCPADVDNDADGDGACESEDNCPVDANASQDDSDGDGNGDACDACPEDAEDDADGDGICGDVDNCPGLSTADQTDTDSDGVGDLCDNCPGVVSSDTTDSDGDGQGNVCDACPADAANDADGDAVCGDVDNCPDVANADQADGESDDVGDACDTCPATALNDTDGDAVCGDVDNCPDDANENQLDRDGDDVGDACDPCPDNNPDSNEDGTCGDYSGPENPDGSLYIYGVYPDEGYQAVALDMLGKIYFSVPYYVSGSSEYTGDVNKIHVQIISEDPDEAPQTPTVLMTSDGYEARFYPNPDLKPDTDYCMLVDIDYQEGVDGRWPLHYSSCFTTTVPCGTTFDAGQDVTIISLGATPQKGLDTLNGWLDEAGEDYPVVFLLQNVPTTATFPFTFDAALAAYETLEDGTHVLQAEGYTSTMYDCTIDGGGALACSADVAVFPTYVDSANIKVDIYVSDVIVVGTLASSGNITSLADFDLAGIVTEDSLLRVEHETGYPLSATIKLDLDTDGDGVNDAATFEISTVPAPLVLEDASCPVE